ncbi:hypothetical protein WUBG_12475 [Wuchereria bancrofti]|uniref:Uncharacterized protein n=1 Tax=Wuchereria bancrofti TaxID=6293 RepID=J9E310_WUCBA|nr:hypothetical protein WUBG_12475 [Wuchereria bancrofti]
MTHRKILEWQMTGVGEQRRDIAVVPTVPLLGEDVPSLADRGGRERLTHARTQYDHIGKRICIHTHTHTFVQTRMYYGLVTSSSFVMTVGSSIFRSIDWDGRRERFLMEREERRGCGTGRGAEDGTEERQQEAGQRQCGVTPRPRKVTGTQSNDLTERKSIEEPFARR